jgi:putative ABC transport system substrate-binding protein
MALSGNDTEKPVLGFLSSGKGPVFEQAWAAFRHGLEEAGADDITIIDRWAGGDYGQLKPMAAYLVSQSVKVIAVTGGATAARAVVEAEHDAQSNIPIVFAAAFLKEAGLLIPKATGLDVYPVDYYKQEFYQEALELLGDLVPGARVGVLINPNCFASLGETTKATARNLAILKASTEREIVAAFAQAREYGVRALLVTPDTFLTSQREQIIVLAARDKLPAVYPWNEYIDDGGLMSVGSSLTTAWRRVGIYAGIVLKGEAAPSDLPVLQTEYSEKVINLEIATALGLRVSPKLLAQFDEVIE